ncbi:hypothetical protein D3C75_386430 [compost metagenome]
MAGNQIIHFAGGHILDINRSYVRNKNIPLIIDRDHVREIDRTPNPDIQLIAGGNQVIVIQSVAALGFIATGKQVGAVRWRQAGFRLWQQFTHVGLARQQHALSILLGKGAGDGRRVGLAA